MTFKEHEASDVARAIRNIDENDIEYRGPPLGQGTYGIVWNGTWTCKVAIKKYTIPPTGIPREVLTLASVRSHENIITLYGVVQHRYTIGIVMEFAPDGSLYDYLHKKGLKPSLEQSVDWATQVARGMKHLHGNDIVHRNLKSPNILLSGKVAKICDFGTARLSERLPGLEGTYRWMAPEVMKCDDARINRRCDTYSYAMVLYELFEHKVPLHEIETESSDVKIIIAVLKNAQRTKITVNLPHYIRRLIEVCWRDDPEKRFAFDQVLQVLKAKDVSDWAEVVTIDTSDLEFGRILGEGGYGTVREGKLKSDRKMTFAIKTIQVRDPAAIPQEIKVWSTLPQHQNITTLIGIASGHFAIHIAMELAVNGSLFGYLHIRKNKPSVERSLGWASDVARGMKHLHDHHIIHRDLKSCNVLLTDEWVAKLCDFGTARKLDHTATTALAGTYRWMAPEIMKAAEARINKKCDLFSYGMILFELFAHEKPYANIDGDAQVSTEVLAGKRPPIPPALPPYLHDLLRSCWEQDPCLRPTFDDFVNKMQTK